MATALDNAVCLGPIGAGQKIDRARPFAPEASMLCSARRGGAWLVRGCATRQEPVEVSMPGLYLEDFAVGRVFEHEIRRTVTEMDNTLFSCLTHNPQPLHIDHEFASKTE